MEQGSIHIYYGNGKGKTTSAVGLCIRAAGAGKRILFYQFMKDNATSERKSLEQLSQVCLIDGLTEEKFSFQLTDKERMERKNFYESQWKRLMTQAREEAYDMLVCDECIYAIAAGLLDEDFVLTSLEDKPKKLEVVLTGNTPSAAMIDRADYVSEIKKVKHPFDHGQAARVGIEK